MCTHKLAARWRAVDVARLTLDLLPRMLLERSGVELEFWSGHVLWVLWREIGEKCVEGGMDGREGAYLVVVACLRSIMVFGDFG